MDAEVGIDEVHFGQEVVDFCKKYVELGKKGNSCGAGYEF